MRRIVVSLSLLVGAVVVPGIAEAQQGVAIVDPGMTKSQVVERLGPPATERTRGEHTYLFFQNGCERQCGMSDLVMLRGDSVVDAIFRSPQRQYSGNSSSPAARAPETARARSTSAPLAVPASASDASTAQPVRAERQVLATAPSTSATADAPAPSSVPAAASPATSVTPVSSSGPSTPSSAAPDSSRSSLPAWPPSGAEPVRAPTGADTIKASPATSASTWPPTTVKSVTDSVAKAARTADSAAVQQAARERATTWPPPRVTPPADSGAAPPKPPED